MRINGMAAVWLFTKLVEREIARARLIHVHITEDQVREMLPGLGKPSCTVHGLNDFKPLLLQSQPDHFPQPRLIVDD